MTPTPSPPPMSDESSKGQVKQISNRKYTKSSVCVSTKEYNKGAWTAEEDKMLSEVIASHGPRRWKTIATKAGLNRCGKSCRLRWMNYLRPNIKRGNITDQEEDLILRLHKLLGNRWSLIAGRLPGRTDNEIKNYWNSHLSKKINAKGKQSGAPGKGMSIKTQDKESDIEQVEGEIKEESTPNGGEDLSIDPFDINEFFDFSNESPLNLEWVSRFLEMDDNKSSN